MRETIVKTRNISNPETTLCRQPSVGISHMSANLGNKVLAALCSEPSFKTGCSEYRGLPYDRFVYRQGRQRECCFQRAGLLMVQCIKNTASRWSKVQPCLLPAVKYSDALILCSSSLPQHTECANVIQPLLSHAVEHGVSGNKYKK